MTRDEAIERVARAMWRVFTGDEEDFPSWDEASPAHKRDTRVLATAAVDEFVAMVPERLKPIESAKNAPGEPE